MCHESELLSSEESRRTEELFSASRECDLEALKKLIAAVVALKKFGS